MKACQRCRQRGKPAPFRCRRCGVRTCEHHAFLQAGFVVQAEKGGKRIERTCVCRDCVDSKPKNESEGAQ